MCGRMKPKTSSWKESFEIIELEDEPAPNCCCSLTPKFGPQINIRSSGLMPPTINGDVPLEPGAGLVFKTAK